MSYYPIFLELEGMRALVVGGGNVAERKVQTLLSHGAKVALIAKELTEQLKELVEEKKILFLGNHFEDSHLESVSVVIAATSDEDLNARVSRCAKERRLLVNVADQPEKCTFIVPSILERGDLVIAVSTSGTSPALAKKIRRQLEARFGIEYAMLLTLMGRLRREVLSWGLPQKDNSDLFHKVVGSGILGAISTENWAEVQSILRKILPSQFATDAKIQGLIQGLG